MYVYTDINTQINVCLQIYFHSCKSYIITHISVCKHVTCIYMSILQLFWYLYEIK